jgi:hypothetical protein
MVRNLIFSLAAAVLVFLGSGVTYAGGGTPTSLFCRCPCAGKTISLSDDEKFALTDVTIGNNGGSPATVGLYDGTLSNSKVAWQVPLPSTFSQSYQTPLIFSTEVDVECDGGTNSNTVVTVSGLILHSY